MRDKKTRGSLFLTFWAILIVAGIVAKRAYGYGDLMVFFHLPAAVFLVLGFVDLSFEIKRKRNEELRNLQLIRQGDSELS